MLPPATPVQHRTGLAPMSTTSSSSYPSSSSSPHYSRLQPLSEAPIPASAGPPILPFVRRMFSPSQMDYQSALDQMASIVSLNPNKVYKTSYYRKQTKNRWSRDDPAFLFLLICFHLISSLIYALSFNLSFAGFLVSTFKTVFLSFLLPGVLVSLSGRQFANRRLRVLRSHSVPQDVELLYAFDIHLNASVPLFLLLHPAQFLLLPLVLSRGFWPLLVSNCLHLVATASYLYVTHLGYRSLPFLAGTESFLYPIVLIGALTALSLVAVPFGISFNASRISCWLFYE